MNIGIVVFAFNRPKLLDNSLKSLLKCKNITKFPITIYVDGPRNHIDKKLIDETLGVINKFSFNFTVNVSDNNKGLACSVIEGVSETLKLYEGVIVLEDDLIYSPYFLNYMSESLFKYERNFRVGSISGYSFDVGIGKFSDNYFHPRPSSWGWATWRDRWNKVSWELSSYDTNVIKMYKFSKNGQDLPRMLRATKKGLRDSWAIRWSYKHFEFNWLCAYPFISLVDNTGFGSEATNCKGVNIFKSSFNKSQTKTFNLAEDTYINKDLVYKFNSYNSNWIKIKKKLKSIFRLR